MTLIKTTLSAGTALAALFAFGGPALAQAAQSTQGTPGAATDITGPTPNVDAAAPAPTPTAQAAGQAAPTTAADAGGAQLEEIVVTAQKREEKLQDVPISVTALTAKTIAAAGINTVEGIALAVPGINITRSSSATLIYLRGIGTSGGQAGQEGAVANFVDGIYQPSVSASTFSLNNIERIEVLKGPQGTLYGRNATGGAVNIITRDPSRDTRVEAGVAYGERDLLEGSFYGTTGLGSAAAIDLAGYYSDTHKGFGENVVTGRRVNTRKDAAIRSKLLIEPTDSTKIVLSGDYSKDSGSYGVSYRPVQNTTRILLGPSPDLGGFYNIQSDFDPFTSTAVYGGSLTIDQDLSAARIKSITAYRADKTFSDLDLDFGPLSLAEARVHQYDRQFTQELQLASPAGSKFQWITGLFFLDATNEYKPFSLFGGVFAANGVYGVYNVAAQKTKSYAAYGQATYPIFDKTDLTLGARYTVDRRSLSGTANVTLLDETTIVPVATLDTHKTFKKPTWRIALDHKFTPDLMLYASYSRGFKSGVYNLTAPTDPVVNPETLDAYEVGLKSELLDRRLRLNLAGYYYDYNDIQLSIIQGASQTLLNAAKATVYGLDADFQAVVASSLTLSGGLQLIHGRYGDFKDAPISAPNPNFPYGTTITSGDASHNKLIRTPTFSGSFGVDYHTPLAGGEFGANVAYSYSGRFAFEPDQYLTQKAYSLVSGQLRWTAPGGHYAVKAFARNLLNTHYWAQKTSSFTGYLGDPAFGRQLGIGLDVKF